MCCCAKPNINGEPGYSWDGKVVSTRQVDPPALADRDVLLFDEPGRCGGMDSHSHHYRLVMNYGHELLVRHGGGDERIRVSLPRGFSFDAMDSNTRYWIFGAMRHAYNDGRWAGSQSESAKWTLAHAEGRLKRRKMPGRDAVKVWIENNVRAAENAEVQS